VPAAAQAQPTEDRQPISFRARPSLWALAGTVLKAGFFFGVALLLIFYPVADYLDQATGFDLSETQILQAATYARLAGLVLGLVVIMVLSMNIVSLKSICYEVTEDRIEWSRGILSRKIDNLDMFRVIDMKLHRSIFDCIFGIGTVTLITKDKTDPEFQFRKIRRPRVLYDIIKKASLDADRKQGVIHIE
jgi:uncharacterized membrane protein YdbT with pleckstrin-like domain